MTSTISKANNSETNVSSIRPQKQRSRTLTENMRGMLREVSAYITFSACVVIGSFFTFTALADQSSQLSTNQQSSITSCSSITMNATTLGASVQMPPILVANGPLRYELAGPKESANTTRTLSETTIGNEQQSITAILGQDYAPLFNMNSGDVALKYTQNEDATYMGTVRTDQQPFGGQAISADLSGVQKIIQRVSLLGDVEYMHYTNEMASKTVGNGPFQYTVPGSTNRMNEVNFGVGAEVHVTTDFGLVGAYSRRFFENIPNANVFRGGAMYQANHILAAATMDYNDGRRFIASGYVSGQQGIIQESLIGGYDMFYKAAFTSDVLAIGSKPDSDYAYYFTDGQRILQQYLLTPGRDVQNSDYTFLPQSMIFVNPVKNVADAISGQAVEQNSTSTFAQVDNTTMLSLTDGGSGPILTESFLRQDVGEFHNSYSVLVGYKLNTSHASFMVEAGAGNRGFSINGAVSIWNWW